MEESMSRAKSVLWMLLDPTILAFPGTVVGWIIAKFLEGPHWTSVSWSYIGVLLLSVSAVAVLPVVDTMRGNKEKARSRVAQGLGWTLITLAAASLTSGIDTLVAQWNVWGWMFFLLFFMIAMIGYGVKKALDTPRPGEIGQGPSRNHGN